MKKEKKTNAGEPKLYKKVIRLLLNWHLWLSLGIAWLITNGWCYILLGIGTYHEIAWMVTVAGAYFAFLWLPFTPEKILTAIIAIFLHKLFFPRDEETLAILKEGYGRVKARWKQRKEKKRQRKAAKNFRSSQNPLAKSAKYDTMELSQIRRGAFMKNPVVAGWYADPESRVYGDTVYMYVTKSLPFDEQLNLDLVTTDDLESFKVYHDILDMSTYHGAHRAIWAPTVIDKDGKYYLIFAANDIHSEEEIGGLYIGVCDTPVGPFQNVFADGRPLINKIYNNAQPIDAHLFKDVDGQIYLYYGGWKHMMVCKMNDTMDGFLPMEEPCYDGIAKEITPADYVEAPYVMVIDGKYHLMYSTGKWGDGTYCVKAGVADTPISGFTYYGDILKAAEIADGPGHNSAFYFKGKHYVAYHRRTVGDTYKHNRMLCIDELPIIDGKLAPVTMT